MCSFNRSICCHFMFLYLKTIYIAIICLYLSIQIIVILNYNNSQPSVSDLWNRKFHILFIFKSKEILNKNVTNIVTFLKRIENHIKNHLVNKITLYRKFTIIAKGLWNFIDVIYISKWDILFFNKERKLINYEMF